MRSSFLRAGCVVVGLVAGTVAPAPAQSHLDPPPPLPQGRPAQGPQVYVPTYRPYNAPPAAAAPQPVNQWAAQPTVAHTPPRQQAPAAPVPLPSRTVAGSAAQTAPAAGTIIPISATAPGVGRPNAAGPTPPSVVQTSGFAPSPAITAHAGNPGASPAPSVLIEKRAPETILFGQPLTYEVSVRNQGSAPVYHVRVEDELPAGVRYLGGDPLGEMGQGRIGWNLGTLEPGAERRLRVDLQPQSEGEIRSVATVTFSAAAAMRTAVVLPRLVLSVRGPEQAMAGENVPLQIQVSNPGSGVVSGLVLRGKLPPGLQHPQGTLVEADLGQLAPGDTRTVTLTTRAAQGGTQLAEVAATADGGLQSTGNVSIQVLEANLKVRRTGPAKCFLKSEINFELEVTNGGSAPANEARLSDILPPGLDFVSATEGGVFDPATRTITWKLGAVAPNGRRTAGYRVKAVGLGEQADRAVVQAERGLESKAESTFNVEGVPALQLELVDLEDPVQVGGELTYEVRVLNQGSCPCTNIQIIAHCPDGLQVHDAKGPVGHRQQGSQVIFEPLPKLATKADEVFRIKVRGIQPGDYRFKVQLTCDQLRQPVNKEEASRVYKD